MKHSKTLLIFQDQFVKKSAYELEITSLKDENSNIQSDVVKTLALIFIITYYKQNTLNVINYHIVFPQKKRVLETSYESEINSIKSKMVIILMCKTSLL